MAIYSGFTYWKWWFIVDLHGFTHWTWWFSIVFCMFTRPGIPYDITDFPTQYGASSESSLRLPKATRRPSKLFSPQTMDGFCWENLQETHGFLPWFFYHQIDRGFRLKFSHHPILWNIPWLLEHMGWTKGTKMPWFFNSFPKRKWFNMATSRNIPILRQPISWRILIEVTWEG